MGGETLLSQTPFWQLMQSGSKHAGPVYPSWHSQKAPWSSPLRTHLPWDEQSLLPWHEGFAHDTPLNPTLPVNVFLRMSDVWMKRREFYVHSQTPDLHTPLFPLQSLGHPLSEQSSPVHIKSQWHLSFWHTPCPEHCVFIVQILSLQSSLVQPGEQAQRMVVLLHTPFPLHSFKHPVSQAFFLSIFEVSALTTPMSVEHRMSERRILSF